MGQRHVSALITQPSAAVFPLLLESFPLAPLLFVIVVDYVLRCTFSSSQNALVIDERSGVKLGALAFADDIATLSPDPLSAQRLLTDLTETKLV